MHVVTPAALLPQVSARRHLAFAQLLPPASDQRRALWLTACYRLTASIERLGQDAALLDLGVCTDAEAVTALQAFIARLHEQEILVQVGVGPSALLAQLALMPCPHGPHGPQHVPLALVTSEQLADRLNLLPIRALARLHLPGLLGRVAITPTIVARLEGYGVRTLAHLARLDEEHLRRQFGARVGATLAAVARGEDLLPLQPTPEPERLHFRLRLPTSVTPDRLLTGLASFARAVAVALGRRCVQGRTLEVRLRWETGASARISRTLAHPIAGGHALVAALGRLLDPLVRAEQALRHRRAIEDLRLIISDLSPRTPEQHAFWPQRAQRLGTTRELAAVLARRHGRPLLFHLVLDAPDAIFECARFRPAPLDADGRTSAGQEHERPDRPSRAPSTSRAAHAADAWEEVPQRLHWW
jgi:nucleotidyltransferase/DNA polymerase involved in DNA repair